ncbi:TPA: signal peptidase I [Vibrio vulnificus]|uniref:Signal peptidase I n=1 Tax=Vibrio vulnificus TaxID=672 RepID=A0A8H9TFU8_VIBVL|nr:signal peptidase I [Vibrio vulnificus]
MSNKKPIYVFKCKYFNIELSLVVLLLGLFAVRSSLLNTYDIPSGSMEPTFQIGDRYISLQAQYNLRAPIIDKAIVSTGDVERGDVVTFLETDSNSRYIKRVIAISGDEVELKGFQISINGEPIATEKVSETEDTVFFKESIGDNEYLVKYSKSFSKLTNLANERSIEDVHAIIDDKTAFLRSGRWVVPEGQVFVMGDNRDNSLDSRFLSYTFVNERDIIGKAFRIVANVCPTSFLPTCFKDPWRNPYKSN